MPITLGLNIASLKSQRQLERSSNELSNVYTRLSSGQRINKASDDAAGLAIADSLNADARVFGQGVRNLNDGLSILNVADGALQELTNITFRLTELAEQAANGVLGVQQRASLDEEAQALKDEYFRIAKSTEFNGRKLFEGDYGELRLQAGYGLDASIGDGLGGAIGTGEFEARSAFSVGSNPYSVLSGDFNGDGALDLVTANWGDDTVSIMLGDGSGGFGAANAFSVGNSPYHVSSGDFNGDGVLDLVTADGLDSTVSVLLGDGSGAFGAANAISVGNTPNSVSSGDFNGDGVLDLVVTNFFDDNVSIFLGDGSGGFGAENTFSVGGGPISVVSGDFNGDGVLDLVTADRYANAVSVLLGDGSGGFGAASAFSVGSNPFSVISGDFNNDGVLDLATADAIGDTVSVLLGDGSGGFGAANAYSVGDTPSSVSSGDFNGDGVLDLITADFGDSTVSVVLGDGSGGFGTASVYSVGSNPRSVSSGDFNGDGVLDLVTADRNSSTVSVLFGSATDGVSPLLDFSLNSIADAKQALSQFTQKLDQLSTQRGQIGAFQSRVEVAEKVLSVSAENYKAAESRIRDADIAQEAADLVRLQILQQASAAVLGQANQQPQLVLQLLGGGN